MSEEINMTCSDIQARLKPFLDDLLAEDEYRAFLSHLEQCSKCKEYVRAIGSLSNQMWRLSDVKISSDLSSNIIFRLSQSKKKAIEKPLILSKKLVFGVIVLIIGFLLLLGGTKFFNAFEPSSKTDKAVNEVVIAKTQIIKEQEPLSDEEAENLFNQLQDMASSLEPVQSSKVDERISKETVLKKEDKPL